MNRVRMAVIGGAVVVALAGGGVGVAAATSGGGEVDHPISGPALERASTAALAEVGEGTVTATEVGDEDGYYEVEVTKPDGSQVDVAVDQNFAVIGSAADVEDPGGDTGDNGS